ncbi:unnamed protein product [Nyctereutes procyonoides]|uniref:(raccoon dog) hypothetical protein n=1 Tax=Nyctereutes procyonoides TaxID=34880 RepID=A0A811Y2I1_NYCPR|nr:unnamed protein product [Nyctereutes procyonoides]
MQVDSRCSGENKCWLFPLAPVMAPRGLSEHLLWVGAGVSGRCRIKPRSGHRLAEPACAGHGPLLSLSVLICTTGMTMAPTSDANKNVPRLQSGPRALPAPAHSLSPLTSHQPPAVPGSHFVQAGVPAWSLSASLLLTCFQRAPAAQAGAQGASPSVSTMRGSCKTAISIHRLSSFGLTFPGVGLRPELSHILWLCEFRGHVPLCRDLASRTQHPRFLLPAYPEIAISPSLPPQQPSPVRAKGCPASLSLHRLPTCPMEWEKALSCTAGRRRVSGTTLIEGNMTMSPRQDLKCSTTKRI